MNETKGNRRKKRTPGQAKGQSRPDTRAEEENYEIGAFRRGAISVFILFHLILITCVAVPLKALTNVKELVMPYMRWSGLFQSWDMFAPDPQAVNSYVKAVLITRDRRMQVWSFPRMEELSFGERLRKERYRKFVEVLPQQQFAPLWPDVAKHLARSLNNQADPPDKILLIQFQSDIRPGAEESSDPVPRPSVFYEDYLQPGDLQ
jgi:hypothetical protein